ncbi:UbiA-like protein EboC [Salinimicrobium sp. 3283s]|uniref:UbiA-like protein EboC n=1 Tax=Autumnicola psychrophila TaxID=3075592 RepID=A0ABU3DRK2_9FLAO|nr:UbiA-like protein EboC [Zunongwangia sp. F225]MDT0686349.1 UbiA-like protein EboC [Zunongwangia sp. F225]
MLPYLKLMRPANIITAFADILAGSSIVAGGLVVFYSADLYLLLLATAGLYGGGVVLNDYFDAEIDQQERPERPIPSGQVTKKEALSLGVVLFLIGIAASFVVNVVSGFLAVAIAVLATAYDAKGKHIDWIGPINMGLCRGLNLLLGMSILPAITGENWYLLFIPVIYIAAITSISKGEVTGSTRKPLYVAAFFYLLVITAIAYLGYESEASDFFSTVLFVILFAALILPPLVRAIKEPSAKKIRLAVKVGIISLIVMNAAIAASSAGLVFGLVVLTLLPFSFLTGKLFPVT